MSSFSKQSDNKTNIDGMIVGFVLFLIIFTGVVVYKYNKQTIDIKVKRVINRSAHVVILSTYGPFVQGSPFYEKYIDKAVKYVMDPNNKVDELLIVGGYTVDPNTSQAQAVLTFIQERYPEFYLSKIPVALDECGITTWQNIKNSKKLMDRNMISPKKITIFAEDSRKQKVAFFANNVFPRGTAPLIAKDETLHEATMYAKLPKEEQIKGFNNPKQQKDFQAQSEKELREQDDTKNADVWPLLTNISKQEGDMYDMQILTTSSELSQEYIDDEHIKLFQEIREFYDEEYGMQKVKDRLDDWTKKAGFNTVENLVQKGCVEYEEFLRK